MTEPLKTQTLRTGLSAAYWCDPTTDYSFEAAHLPAMTRSAGAKQTSWFDELFEGGLRIPDRDAHTTMSLVVTGPPGTGKTTLCLELCYRLATASRDTDRLRSLYLTTEGHAPWLVQHAREFGWDTGKNILDESTDAPVCVRALKTEDDFADFRSELRSGTDSNSQSFGLLIDELHEGIFGTDSKTPLRRASPLQARSSLDLSTFDVVVFDNLNTLRIDKGLWFQTMVDLGNLGPRLVIVVADSTGTDEISELWEYLADVVIRMGRENRETGGYLIRTIEIVKSRYQISALGRHQVKIHKAYPSEGSAKDRWLRMRHHPFREEGGVFIYPSMHFVLSRHKYLYPLEPEETRGGIPPCFDELKMMLKGTFHPGRCVAFVGGHGTHKSRLAFIQVLFTLSQLPNASALIISLGEDEVSTARNLEEIARDQFPSKALNVKDLIASGRLEIAYYPPGFITPEEFFHRLQLSIARHRAGSLNRNTVLVAFNSLNLLHSHFPLCAEHKVFIPAVVELLGHEGVTSFFVSGGSASDDVYGLLSLADPILEFERVDCKKQYVFEHVLPKDVDTTNLIMCPDEFSLVKVSVARFAGGTSAGAHGFLGLVTSDDVLGHVVQRGLRLWLPR